MSAKELLFSAGDEHAGWALAAAGISATSFEQCDVVVSAAPLPERQAILRHAITSGKSALSLGIPAATLSGSIELFGLAAAAGVALDVRDIAAYDGAIPAIAAQIRSNALGRIRLLRVELFSDAPSRWDAISRALAPLLVLAEAEPLEVVARMHEGETNTLVASLRFPTCDGHLLASNRHPNRAVRMTVIGELAQVSWDGTHLVLERSGGECAPLRIDDSPAAALAVRSYGTGADRQGLTLLRSLEAIRVAAATDRKAQPRHVQWEAAGVMVHPTAVIEDDVQIGTGSKIWHFSHILDRVRIGSRVNIGQNVVIGPDVAVGNNCKIQNNVSVYKGVTLEDGVFCGPSCVFTNVKNPRAEIERKSEFLPTLVRRGASIGANATIVCGHTLGSYCFIAAGAVVAGNVPDFAIMAGVPARRIGWASHAGVKLGADLVCPTEGRRYRQIGPDKLEEIAE